MFANRRVSSSATGSPAEHPLQVENRTLRLRLEALLHEARQNEAKLRRFDVLERQLISARSLVEVLHLLLVEYAAAFDIERVGLALVDAEYEIARVVDAAGRGSLPATLRLLPDVAPLTALFAGRPHTRLCRFDARQHGALLDAPSSGLASVALLPLVRQGQLIGALLLGSAIAERYDQNIATDFLDRLAAIAAICIENALAQERLKRAGLTDALTGVHNRRYFEHRCPIEASQALRHRQPLVCMFIDVDRFKRINDGFGHPFGDRVLRGVAGAIQGQLRTTDTVARYGGEEFVVLLPQTTLADAREIAERVRQGVASTAFVTPDGQQMPVSVSIGLAALRLDAPPTAVDTQVATLIASADRALYQAKESGRNRIVAIGLPTAHTSSRLGTLRLTLGQWYSRLRSQSLALR